MRSKAVGLPVGEKFDVMHFDKRRTTLLNDFNEYRTHYTEIAQFFSPRSGFHLRQTSGNQNPIRGTKQHRAIIDSTTIRVARNAAAGLQAGITSPSRPWKRLGPDDPELNDEHGARAFYAELDKRFDHVLTRTNFYQSCLQGYADYVKFGPAAIQVDEHEETVFRCIVHPIGSWVAAKNSDGQVDVFYRDYKVTGHELVGKFGEDALERGLLQDIRQNPYSRHDLYNAIEPNPYWAGEDVPAIGLAAFKYVSAWWVGGREKKFVKLHGYHEFPVMVFSMYRTDQSDVYGYGAGLESLGDAKQLQHMQRMKLKGIDKMVDPTLQAPTSLQQMGVSQIPGETNYHDSPQKIESIYNINLPLQYVYEDIDATQQRLRESFFEDLFLMINTSINRQTTAREIEERHQEKLVMLGPVLESLITDWLNPVVHRVLSIMQRAGLWPEAPPSLVGHDFKIDYVSILATAQRAVQTIAIEQGLNFVAQARQFGFELMADRIDQDGVFDAYMERIGFPPEGIVELGIAEKNRAVREQMMAQERNLALAQQGASAAADASKADLTQPNILTQMLGQVAA